MNKKNIIAAVKKRVRALFEKEGSGHDWWHIERVLNAATAIARAEKGADLFITQLGALLHDIADFKFHDGDEKIGGQKAAALLQKLGADTATIDQVRHIVDNASFKGLGVASGMRSLEGKIVQDADRLDAIGAIGIARAFAYGGFKQRPMYNPEGKAKKHATFESYKKGADSTIHHFYEKLLHLKNGMNTKTGKRLAAQRHAYLENYLKHFLQEWSGKR